MQILEDAENAVRERFWQPQRGQVALDVGSYFGTYTLPALTAGAFVIAVDGREYTLLALRDIVEAEGFGDRLAIVHATVFDGGPYPTELRQQIESCAFASSRRMLPDDRGPWTTLDDLPVVGLSQLDWLKVDVEGGELGLMQNAQRMLTRLRPRVLVEDHSRIYRWTAEQDTTAGLLRLFDELDYDAEVWPQQHVDYVIGTPR